MLLIFGDNTEESITTIKVLAEEQGTRDEVREPLV